MGFLKANKLKMYACMMVGPSFTSEPNEAKKRLYVSADDSDDGAAAARHASSKADVLSLHNLVVR